MYDGLSRIVESGEFQLESAHATELLDDEIASSYESFRNWFSNGSRREITFTLYDKELKYTHGAKSTHEEISNAFGKDGQRYLRNRVATTMYIESIGNDTLPYNVNGILNNAGLVAYHKYKNASHYSYDPHGNVDKLIQEIPALAAAPYNRRFFTLDYSYDLVSGNVNQVAYQEGYKDAFYHRYFYDADNRIWKVETSRDQVIWEKEAKYYYYPHGPLSRTEIGDQNIQGLDYAYTIQGWLKAVNGSSLGDDPGEFDFGRDAHQSLGENDLFGRDAFAFSLYYFDEDYEAISNQNAIQKEMGGGDYTSNTYDLFNGNIRKMVLAMTDNNQSPMSVSANAYRYDQLNRIKSFKSYTGFNLGNDNLAQGLLEWGNNADYSYDPNGNLLSLNRSENNIEMDDLVYKYDLNTPNTGKRNRLLQVMDDPSLANNFTTDIDNQTANFDDTKTADPAYNNYRYDEIGNLISDKAEGIDLINWMVSGKVKSIERSSLNSMPNLKFEYDALGNRIRKLNEGTTANDFAAKSTWYIRDASGNVMSVYEQESASLTAKEQHIYGSDRLGIKLADNSGSDPLNFSNFNFNLIPWEAYQIFPDDDDETFTVNISGEYELFLKCLEGEILIEAEDISILSGIYEIVPGIGIKLYAGNSLSFKATTNTGSWTLESEFPFEISSSKLGFLEDGNYKMIKLDDDLERNLGDRRYELKNHLGNVHAVISDRKLQVEDPNNLGTVDYYTSNVTSYTDYYPFGMVMPNRFYQGSDYYRYGFQGQEGDPELKGEGNSLNYKYRMHDPRTGRFFATDPLESKYPYLTPYQFSSNQPIHAKELEGLESDNELGVTNIGLTYSFGNSEKNIGIGVKRVDPIGASASTISYQLLISYSFTTFGTGTSSTRLAANTTITLPVATNTTYSFGSTLYLNNDGTSQRTGNIGINSGDFSIRFEDDFIPLVSLSLISGVSNFLFKTKFKLYYNPILSDGRDRYKSAWVEVVYRDARKGLNFAFGAFAATGEPQATEGNTPGFLGTAKMVNKRVIFGKKKNLATGLGYVSFGADAWGSGSPFKTKLTIGADYGVFQEWFQNGFHRMAGMNQLTIVKNENRLVKEGYVTQIGNTFLWN